MSDWNDWWEYRTLYDLHVVTPDGTSHQVGAVKIAQIGLQRGDVGPGDGRPDLPAAFETLDDTFYSVGQDASYYATIAGFDVTFRDALLHGLRDIAADEALWESVQGERALRKSLLRSVKDASVTGQYRRAAKGGAPLSDFNFAYVPPWPHESDRPAAPVTFEVSAKSCPPTNIHVLIGSNGVGKTRMLNSMAWAISAGPGDKERGTFHDLDDFGTSPFVNVLTVSFSAFDRLVLPPTPEGEVPRVQYIGLKGSLNPDSEDVPPKSVVELSDEFERSLRECRLRGRALRWRQAIEPLEADRVFLDSGIKSLITAPEGEMDARRGEKIAAKVFQTLSSGHGAVLLTITKLVEMVEERTLVLMDEPEAHLHPPLLSALVRAISDLLINYNGVAVIATHSPVVLQEVPRKCAWKIRRVGLQTAMDRPVIETFGENVGVLTREVFGLEVARSGFHRMLAEAVDRGLSFEDVCAMFNDELGGEAQAILQALIVARSADNE